MRVAGNCRHQRWRRLTTASTEPSPKVTLVATERPPSRPNKRQTGCPKRCPHQSQRARSTAQRAGGDNGCSKGASRWRSAGSISTSFGINASSSEAKWSVLKARCPVSNPPVSPRPMQPSRLKVSSRCSTLAVVPRLMASGTALVREKRRRDQPIVLIRQSPSWHKLAVTHTKRRFHRRRSPGSPPALALSSPASPSLAKTNPAPSTRDEEQRGSYWITTFGCQMNKADSERMA